MAQLTEINIADLHPTQLTLGMEEVETRKQRIKALSAKEFQDLVMEKAVPHVLGPDRQVFMIDHHHFCRVLYDLGHRKVMLGKCREDWSDLGRERFWKRMEKRGLCWPIDVAGNHRPALKIPAHVKHLTDNPWRTLARGVRGEAFKDKDTPFQEFMWGEYFRSFMATRLLETDIVLARKLAVKLSRLDEARDLPGYLGPR